MRFLIVSLGLHPDIDGGAWRVAAAQARGLASRGHSVDVVTAQTDPPGPERETRDGFIIHRFPQSQGQFHSNWRNENLAARALLAQLAANRDPGVPTLLIQHHPYLGPAVEGVPRSIPILHIFHGPWALEYRLAQTARRRGIVRKCLDLVVPRVMRRVEARCLRRAQRIVTLSRHFATQLPAWFPGPLPPIEVVHGGVDFDQFHPLSDADRRSVRARLGLSPDEMLFVALRRLDPRMGLDVLVDAFARVVVKHPRARLWLTGRGPAEGALRSRIERLGVGGSARLLGFVPESEVSGLLNSADAVVMPSLDLEGFGLVTVEALACGTPVLGSRAGATPEILDPLDRGLLFPPASVAGLAERLDEALRNPRGLPSRGRCAAYARERFPWDAQLTACERLGAELTSLTQPIAA